MEKILLTYILIFKIGVLSAQNASSELIVGTWRFEKICDLRTEEEKNEFDEIPWCPPDTENGTGYADRIFKNNNEFEFYLTKTVSDFGLYQIKGGKLIIERRISEEQAKQNPEGMKRGLKRNLIEKKEDGYYYYRPYELDLKSVSENQIEFGTEKHYTVWKRIE